jgi:hypothetical protein
MLNRACSIIVSYFSRLGNVPVDVLVAGTSSLENWIGMAALFSLSAGHNIFSGD